MSLYGQICVLLLIIYQIPAHLTMSVRAKIMSSCAIISRHRSEWRSVESLMYNEKAQSSHGSAKRAAGIARLRFGIFQAEPKTIDRRKGSGACPKRHAATLAPLAL